MQAESLCLEIALRILASSEGTCSQKYHPECFVAVQHILKDEKRMALIKSVTPMRRVGEANEIAGMPQSNDHC